MSAVLDTALFDLQAFNSALESTSAPLPLFKATLKQANQALAERFHAGRAATELVAARASLVDELIIQAWKLFFKANDTGIALVAVGGYGRGELHPNSDVDVMLLLADSDEAYRDAIQSFLTFLWDIGLEIGQSVRSVDECVSEAGKDITVATNLQEARLLIGPETLFEEQRRRCAPDQIWPSVEFFSAKLDEQIKRHQKFDDTAYNLEPNIKEGPGGLRDIQMIGWVAKRHFGADNLHELVAHEFLTEQEYQALHEGQSFLWQVRYGLHLVAGRREDRLLFDHQRVLAKQFGYQDSFRRLAVEQFMKQYYRTVMELSRLNEMLLQLFQEELLYANDDSNPRQLNRRFQVRKGFLEVSHDDIFKHYPFALLEVFLLFQQHPELKGIRANTVRLIREHHYLIDSNFRDDLRNKTLFMEILRHGEGVTHVLRRMNIYGVLAAYLPVFRNIVGQMQHDLFHVYTVDEHTLRVIRNIRRFTVPEFHHEFPLCSDIIEIIPKQELLICAGLFHDIAKGRGGDHSKLGAIDAREFCRQHELGDYDTNMVSWLVENHLILSSTAQRKDISDPDVVNEFARQVGDQIHLNYLYILTVADIRATSDSVWNSWKDSLLRELYHATSRALRRGLESPLQQSEYIKENKRQSLDLLKKLSVQRDEAESLWEKLGNNYFLRYRADEVAWHTQAILHSKEHGSKADLPLILMREDSRRGGTEVFIYTPSLNNLFTRITSVLEQAGLNIVDARIITSNDEYSLDSFLVLDHSGEAVTDTTRLQGLEERLRRQIRDTEASLPTIDQRLARQAKHFTFPTEVHFENDSDCEQTVLYIKAYDRPGLLSRIGEALNQHQIQLHNAKIATFGERVEDIFYITDMEHKPLSSIDYEAVENTLLEYLSD